MPRLRRLLADVTPLRESPAVPPVVDRLDAVLGRLGPHRLRYPAAGLRDHQVVVRGRRARAGADDSHDRDRAGGRFARRRDGPAQARAARERRIGGGVRRARGAGVRRAAAGLAALRARGRAVRAVRDHGAAAADVHPRPAPARAAAGRDGAGPDQVPAHADDRPGAGWPDRGRAAPRAAGLLSSSTSAPSPGRSTGSPGCGCRPTAAVAQFGPRAVGAGGALRPAQQGAGRRVPGRPQRHRLRAAGRTVPGHQRRAVRRQPAHARPVRHRDRRGRPGQRGAVRPGRVDQPEGPGDAVLGRASGAPRSPGSRSRRACGSP